MTARRAAYKDGASPRRRPLRVRTGLSSVHLGRCRQSCGRADAWLRSRRNVPAVADRAWVPGGRARNPISQVPLRSFYARSALDRHGFTPGKFGLTVISQTLSQRCVAEQVTLLAAVRRSGQRGAGAAVPAVDGDADGDARPRRRARPRRPARPGGPAGGGPAVRVAELQDRPRVSRARPGAAPGPG